ncbi:hypothetical protein JHK87_044846 [Glycine soja]|nr:hypothetical protein JHK87_044846 [Glycine soja]
MLRKLCGIESFYFDDKFRYPENSAPAQLPRTMDVIADDDLVDSCKPGDRVAIVGIYKALARKRQTVLIANNVSLLNKEANAPIYSAEDVKNIKEITARDDAFDLLTNSLAPSIYGHSWIKIAVVLLMLNGVEKNLKNGIHLRGLEFSLDLLSNVTIKFLIKFIHYIQPELTDEVSSYLSILDFDIPFPILSFTLSPLSYSQLDNNDFGGNSIPESYGNISKLSKL